MTKTSSARVTTEQKKQRVLRAALDCFSEHGIGGTTIEMIRDASGMSVGSLYHHFGNKDKIAAGVFREGMRQYGDLTRKYLEPILSKQQQWADNNGNKPYEFAELGVRALVHAQVDWISGSPCWAKFVFQQRGALAKADQEASFEHDKSLFTRDIGEWFVPCAQRGLLRPMPMEMFSVLITGPTQEYARHWLAGRYKTPLIKQKDALADAAWLALKVNEK